MVLTDDRLELTIQGTGTTFGKLLLRDGETMTPLASDRPYLALDGFVHAVG